MGLDMKRTRRILLLLISIIIGLTGLPHLSQAEGLPFRDVNVGDWFYKDVLKMNAIGVIQGYPDSSFKPSAGVTKAEALLMLIRYMGLSGELEKMSDTDLYLYLPALGLEKGKLPEWAQKPLAFGKKMGWLQIYSGSFDWQGKANRAWISELLIRAIQKVGDAENMSTDATEFSDDAKIPNASRGFVNAAVKYGLMKGYPADQSFRPDGAVTRAEMATLLPRLDPYISVAMPKAEGVVVEAGYGSLSVIDKAGKQSTYAVNPNAFLFADGASLPLSTLKPKDQVVLYLKGDQVVFVERLAENVSLYQEVKGTVVDVVTVEHLISMQLTSGDYLTLSYDEAQDADMPLYLNRTVTVTYAPESNRIIQIKVEGDGSGQGLRGEIVSINTEKKLLILKDDLGKPYTFTYTDQTVVQMEGRRFPTVEDLRAGDRVEVDPKGNILTEIRVIGVSDQTEVTGIVEAILYENRLLNLRVGSEIPGFYWAEEVKVTINGSTEASIDDVRAGDQVKLTLSNRTIKRIDLMGISQNRTSGKVASIDQTQGILTLEDENGKLGAYRLDPDFKVYLDGAEVKKTRLTVGVPVKLEFRRDLVVSVQLDLVRTGTVLSYDQAKRELAVREGGEDRRYPLGGSFTLHAFAHPSMTVSQLPVGGEVKLLLNPDGSIASIRLTERGLYTLLDHTYSTGRLKLKDEQGNTVSVAYTDQTKLINADGTPGRWQDLTAGERLYLTFSGMDPVQVERELNLIGQVKRIGSSDGTFVVDRLGKEVSFPLGSGIQVSVGDYVRVNRVGAAVTVTKGTVGRAVVDYVDEPDMQIYVKEGAGYRWLSFDKEAVVKKRGVWSRISDLMKNDEIFYYSIDGNVIAFEVK